MFDQEGGPGFSIEGKFFSLEPGARIAHVERMLMPDPTSDNSIETVFEAEAAGTKMTLRMRLPDSASRKALLDSGAAVGMELCYDLLDCLAPADGN